MSEQIQAMIHTKAGPWTLTSQLTKTNNSTLYYTSDPNWVVKIGEAKEIQEEIDIIRRIHGSTKPIRNTVTLPTEEQALSGSIDDVSGSGPKESWYAMRRYNRHADLNDPYCRKYWRILGCHVLNFLEDLHRNYGLIHGDIKETNVYVNPVENEFVVGDFGLTTGVEPVVLLPTNNDAYTWYFLTFGAERDQPYHSWRMDFMMLGYVLAKLSWDLVKNARMIHMEVFDVRTKRGSYPLMSDDQLLALRDAELGSAHPVVLRFFAYVREHVPWAYEVGEAPPVAVYEELRRILMS